MPFFEILHVKTLFHVESKCQIVNFLVVCIHQVRSHDVASWNLFSQSQTLPLLVSSDGSATQNRIFEYLPGISRDIGSKKAC